VSNSGVDSRELSLTDGISVVIPVYNSEASLAPLIERLLAVLPSLAPAFEVILVNDGSRDRSWEIVRGLAAAHQSVRGINLLRNFGQHNALLCGIRAARFSTTVTMDDDLQHPPEEIASLIAKLKEGADVVYGTPERERHGFLRDLASKSTKIALRLALRVPTAVDVSAFRAFRTYLRDAFAPFNSPYVSIDVLLSWGTSRFSSVKVRHDARVLGTSNYTTGKLIRHAINLTTGFSTWPLRLASLTGFAFTCMGFLTLMYVLVMFVIRGRVVPGFAFLASTLAIFSGAQLFALGIIGEYLARMFVRSSDRPAYVVRLESAGSEGTDDANRSLLR
jgi:glycosyltransferase involved in cell wall biosynthesis